MIFCENNFCLYWEGGACVVKDVALSLQGVCETCICIDLPETFLESRRKAQLTRRENESTHDKPLQ